MSTDKLQALHNTVSEILNEPPAPPTFFDDDPGSAAPASHPIAKDSDSPEQGAAAPKGNFGKLAAGGDRTSTLFGPEAQMSRETAEESASKVRQQMAAQVQASLLADKASQGLAGQVPDSARDTEVAGTFRRWGLRGLAGVLLAGIGIVAFNWLGSSGNTAGTAPAQPAPVAQVAPAVVAASPAVAAAPPVVTAVSPELTSSVQAMSRNLASLGKEIEQLKAERASMVRENAGLVEQLKAGQEKQTRAVAALSEQLKTGQEQAARDKANAEEQIRGMRDQLDRLGSQVSDQKARPRIVAAPPRPPAPRPDAAAAPRQPAPPPSATQAAAQPKPKPPSTPSTSRPPASASPPTPAR